MAKVIEDVIIIKISRIVKDGSSDNVLSDDQKEMLSGTIPQLVEEVLNDGGLIVELAELE